MCVSSGKTYTGYVRSQRFSKAHAVQCGLHFHRGFEIFVLAPGINGKRLHVLVVETRCIRIFFFFGIGSSKRFQHLAILGYLRYVRTSSLAFCGTSIVHHWYLVCTYAVCVPCCFPNEKSENLETSMDSGG